MCPEMVIHLGYARDLLGLRAHTNMIIWFAEAYDIIYSGIGYYL